MFTISKQLGIGTVQNIEEGKVTVYFSEEDETKVLLEQFTKIYSTYEEAALALDPDMTEAELNESWARIQEENRQSAEGRKAMAWLEETNREASKKLMKNI